MWLVLRTNSTNTSASVGCWLFLVLVLRTNRNVFDVSTNSLTELEPTPTNSTNTQPTLSVNYPLTGLERIRPLTCQKRGLEVHVKAPVGSLNFGEKLFSKQEFWGFGIKKFMIPRSPKSSKLARSSYFLKNPDGGFAPLQL